MQATIILISNHNPKKWQDSMLSSSEPPGRSAGLGHSCRASAATVLPLRQMLQVAGSSLRTRGCLQALLGQLLIPPGSLRPDFKQSPNLRLRHPEEAAASSVSADQPPLSGVRPLKTRRPSKTTVDLSRHAPSYSPQTCPRCPWLQARCSFWAPSWQSSTRATMAEKASHRVSLRKQSALPPLTSCVLALFWSAKHTTCGGMLHPLKREQDPSYSGPLLGHPLLASVLPV